MTQSSIGEGCVVLTPVGGAIDPECERALRVLETRGYTVRRVVGYSDVALARSQMATDALRAGFEELMWIDSDIRFDPNHVDTLRRHNLDIVCAIYPQKGSRALSCHVLPGTTEILFGKVGGVIKVLYAAGGFLLTRRCVYQRIQETEKLPICNQRFQRPVLPFFLPLIVSEGTDDHWMLGEDFAFCERARRAGFDIHADTTLRLEHVGSFGYGWEDAGLARARFESFRFTLV